MDWVDHLRQLINTTQAAAHNCLLPRRLETAMLKGAALPLARIKDLPNHQKNFKSPFLKKISKFVQICQPFFVNFKSFLLLFLGKI
jgi:hypothetical protein